MADAIGDISSSLSVDDSRTIYQTPNRQTASHFASMAYSPGSPYLYPPPSPRVLPSLPPPWTPPWKDWSWSHGPGIAAAVFASMACALVLKCVCVLCPWPCYVNNAVRHRRDDYGAAQRRWPREPRDGQNRRSTSNTRRQLQRPAASLPAPFAYNLSAQKTVAATGGDEAAATCSVCLGVFEFGEMVRLLPVCLHLYHVECIDPWLDAHSTCPICRSETDPTPAVDVARLQPV
ncbi:hypothetical protein ACP70R_043175 [Stipagrostis hirtigluma subsp. patula]